MSRQYKFHNKEGLYFVSFATVYWIDVFVREEYCSIISENLNFYSRENGMEVFCWCIMSSHLHLIFRDTNNEPEKLLGRFKSYTSKVLQKEIELNQSKSRKEWMKWMFERAASKNSNVKNGMFWQHHNKPIELWSIDVIEQKANYIHHNPVTAGFVTQPEHWKYSSAIDYCGGKGLVDIKMLW